MLILFYILFFLIILAQLVVTVVATIKQRQNKYSFSKAIVIVMGAMFIANWAELLLDFLFQEYL